MKKILLLGLLMFVSYSYAFAATVTDERVMLQGARPMGMGGAFTAVSDDENAVFYNPAGITQRSAYLMQYFDLSVKVSNASFWSGDYNNMDNLDNNHSVIKENPNIMLSLVNLNFISAPIKAGENYISFGAGFFMYGNADFKFNYASSAPNRLILNYDIQGAFIFNVPLAYKITSLEAIKMPGSLSLGMNLKYIDKLKAAESVYSDEYDNVSIDYRGGSGAGLDLGMIYHFSPVWNFGLQISDVFTTRINYARLSNSVSSGAVGMAAEAYTGEIPPEVNVGAVYILPIDEKSRVIFAGDIRDLSNSYEDGVIDRIHLGAEYRYSVLALRLGLNSGRPAFGIGIESNVVQLTYAFYGDHNRYTDNTDWFHEINFSIKTGHNRGIGYGAKRQSGKSTEEVTDNKGKDAAKGTAEITDGDKATDNK